MCVPAFTTYFLSADLTGLQYYTRAISSPFGQKVFQFYTTTSKQVLDIHEEAKRLKESQTDKHVDVSTGTASTAVGTAAPPLDPSVQSTEKPLTS